MINNYSDLLQFWCAEDFSKLKRHVYKYTNCGAWIVLIDKKNKTYSECDNNIDEGFLINNIIGFKISSIIEGSDVELKPHVLKFPLKKSELENIIEELESECEHYWKRDNLDNWE
jgi:hypothetical protein